MFAARLVITGELVLLSPLHLGTGEVAAYAKIPQDPDSDEKKPTTVATVMRGVDGLPVVPGASLKGVLRSLVEGEAGANALFGPPTGGEPAADGSDEKKLYQGRLTAHAMRYASGEPAKLAHGLPFAGKEMPDGVALEQRGLFIAARTAIDPGSGVADEGKLFHQEMVAPDARFAMRLVLRLDPDGSGGDAAACLVTALKALCREGGVAFGKGQSLGQGRMRLDLESLEAKRLTLVKATGALLDANAEATKKELRQAVEAAGEPAGGLFARHALKLTCDGPFLIDDTSVKPPKKSELPRLNAQRRGDKPLLSGSTVTGALRARAGWLAKLRWNDDEAKRRDERGLILDLNDQAAAAADRERVVICPKELSPTERLFGVTGWRGLVRVAKVACTSCADFEKITSVKLDRFSMAPIDGALFTTKAAIDPVFEVVLEVEQRGGFPDADDTALLSALLEDLRQEGIMLGHGTSRGYGWFGVEVDPLQARGAN